MAKKKSKESKKSSDKSKSNSIFNTLFGDSPEDSTAASLFSDDNPFRRKPNDSSQTTPTQKEQLGFEKPPIEIESAELKKKKRKKDQKEELDSESIVEESKKLKKDGDSQEIVNSIELSEKRKKKKATLELNPENVPEKKPKKEENSDDLSMKSEESEKKKKKKRNRDELEVNYEKKLYGEEAMKDDDTNEEEKAPMVGEKRKTIDNPEDLTLQKEGFDDEDKLSRTIFVGNLPLKIKKKILLKEFEKFGEVESVRIRSVPIADGKVPRKGAIIQKKLNENADSVNAYIVFKTEESAQASLTHNIAVVEGNHIRVDRACPPRKKLKGETATLYDNKRTIFVGNLPFDVKDEELYKLFTSLKNLETSLEAVRVIRDPSTSLGKGIAYVLFKTKEAADMVVKNRFLKLRDRQLRISRSKPNTNPNPIQSENNTVSGKGNIRSKKFLEDSRSNNGNKTMSYQGLQASKSGETKKVKTGKMVNVSLGKEKKVKEGDDKRKRPTVAARKAKALKDEAILKQGQGGGTKRKFEKRTPDKKAKFSKKARKY